MEFRKNDIVTLEIVDCGTDGEGIGKADGFTVFVKDAVIGDTVKAKRPINLSPTGTPAFFLVRITFVPSLISTSDPNRMQPIVSF